MGFELGPRVHDAVRRIHGGRRQVDPDRSGYRPTSPFTFGRAAGRGSTSDWHEIKVSFVRELRIMLEGVWNR
jgi:hypothetical protein